MNLDNFSTVVDDRRYIKPQVALDESNTFIENLRNSQGQRTGEIAQDTYNLGTAVPSNLGGLGGSGSYFTSRYQTPQTNEIVANLKATAQAQALNDAMNNALAQAKQRYNNAYKSAQRRGGNPANPTNPTTTPQDEDGTVDHTDSGGRRVQKKRFAGSEKPDQSAKKNYDVLTHLGKKQASISVEFDKNGNVVYLNNGAVTFTGPKAQAQWNSNYSKRKLVER